MRKVMIVTDTQRTPELAKLGNCLRDSFQKRQWITEMLDFKPGINDYIYFRSIMDYKPDFLVTLNLAGFTMKTDGQETSLNRIPCRMAHLMFDSYRDFQDVLNHTINFSMYFFTNEQKTALALERDFPHIEHICYLEELKALQDNRLGEITQIMDTITDKILHIAEF